jgi:Protein of unknown function (DUF642)
MYKLIHLTATQPQGFNMIKRKLLAFAMLVLPTLASANLVTNGDFETAAGAGWITTPTVGFANISAYTGCCGASGTYPTAPGAAFFGWGDTTGGTLAQDIATVIGQSYVVTFAHGALIGNTPQTLLAAAIGAAGTLNSQSASATGTYDFASTLTNYSFSFVADSATTRLLFTDTSTSTASVDGILDNVTVNAVPVPASLPLLLAGMAMFGVTTRKKKLQ